MPRRTPIDHRMVVDLYKKLGNARAVARELGLHYQTVNAHLRRERGVCTNCSNSVPPGQPYCQPCRDRLAASVKAKRAGRRRLGICAVCDERIQPPSRIYCAAHRLAHLEASERSEAKKKRGAPNAGVPNEMQRHLAIREKYGSGGVKAWLRDEGCCVACGVAHKDRAVHVHHLDLGSGRRESPDDFICLCFVCHQALHKIVEHPRLSSFLAIIARNYPHVAEALEQHGHD